MDASRLERAARALREIELSALAHHAHEGKMTLLHALQVEIPKMAEDARAALAAEQRTPPATAPLAAIRRVLDVAANEGNRFTATPADVAEVRAWLDGRGS